MEHLFLHGSLGRLPEGRVRRVRQRVTMKRGTLNSQKAVEGIKEQQKEIAALESEDVELRERIKAL
jgi:hypothetical protein